MSKWKRDNSIAVLMELCLSHINSQHFLSIVRWTKLCAYFIVLLYCHTPILTQWGWDKMAAVFTKTSFCSPSPPNPNLPSHPTQVYSVMKLKFKVNHIEFSCFVWCFVLLHVGTHYVTIKHFWNEMFWNEMNGFESLFDCVTKSSIWHCMVIWSMADICCMDK